VAPEKVRAVSSPRALNAAEIDECDSLAELGAPGIAREYRAGRAVDSGDDERRRHGPIRAERPFDVRRDRQSPHARRTITNAQSRQLDRIGQGNALQQL